MTGPRVRIRAYIWDRGSVFPVAGVMVNSGGTHAFIPGGELRGVADALHDRADEMEAEQ